MQNFSARTGISLAADATDGYQIPPGLPQNDFCLIMQNFGRCEMVPNAAAPLRGDEPQLRYDGAQIGHLIIPICDGRHLLGRLVSEPFAVSQPDFATVYALARALAVHPDHLLRGQASLPFLAGEQGQREEAYSGPDPNGTGDLRRLLVEMSDFVLQSKRPLSVPDASQSPWTQHLLGRQDVQGSITITPLLQQDRLRGTLGIYAGDASRDPESDLHLLSMLSAQAVNSLVMLERLVASEEQALTDSLTGLYN